jgi:hypothetical protein
VSGRRNKKPKHGDDRRRNQNPPPQNQGGGPPPADTVRIEPAPDDGENKAEAKRSGERQLRLALILNWITAIGTVGGLIGIIFLVQTLITAQEANQIGRSVLVVEQRAFVSYTEMYAVSGKDRGTGAKAWALNPRFKNSGNSAATSVHIHVNINMPDWKELPEEFEYADKPSPTSGVFPNTSVIDYPMIIGSQIETGGGQVSIPDDIAEQVNVGKAHVYIWGHVDYDDIFTCHHTTRFCEQLVYREQVGSGRFYWQNCDSNCADATCKGFQVTAKPVCLQAETK